MTFPLGGRRLIEASAGTGKTYSISHLYLRLLLGVGEGISPDTALTVEQILVVTFTRAAADELRGRVRTLLERTQAELRCGESRNPLVRELIGMTEDDDERRQAMQRRLRAALLSMDEAAISTIHAFAVKAASAFLFEIGAIDDARLSHDGGGRDDRILTDFYRRLVNDETLSLVYELLDSPSLDKFLSYWRAAVPPDAGTCPQVSDRAQAALTAVAMDYRVLVEQHRQLAAEWQTFSANAGGAFDATAAKQRLLAVLQEETNSQLGAGDVGHLVKYVNDSLADTVFQLADKRDTVYGKRWWATTLAPDATPPLDLLRRIRDHLEAVLATRQALGQRARAAVLLRLRELRAQLDLRDMTLDEVITLVNRRLEDEGSGDALRKVITARYPVCLVDEFQDTDPEQFRMFDRLYAGTDPAPGAGLFMIGDPKQSIYAFRGADLFAYLNVRAGVVDARAAGDVSRGIYHLGTNFRSCAGLVNGVNALFAEQGDKQPGTPTFVFEGMRYQPVDDSEAALPGRIGRYRVGEDCPVSDQPLAFVGHPGGDPASGAFNANRIIPLFARDAAARISALLCPESGARIGDEGADRALKPCDIAVLVRNRQEARAIREALAAPAIGLRSVFASQRDSVFADAEIAEDLLLVLRAIDACRDRRLLKSALATPLMRGFTPGLDAAARLDVHDDELERTIAEFGACRATWLAHGVLPALDQLLANPHRALFERIAARADSDRLFTDLRHLGDLLQQQDLACDSPEQLIDWFTACLDDDSDLDEDVRRIRLESDEDLVRVVTVFSAKGLEYPVVFLPFFFLPKLPDLSRKLPLYRTHEAGFWRAIVDFESDPDDVKARMRREALAEDIRLLYVAVTRAVYQCHIGIAAATHGTRTALFAHSPWGHLLAPPADRGARPDHPDRAWLFEALRRRLDGAARHADFAVAGAVSPVPFQPAAGTLMHPVEPPPVSGPQSSWRVTSYTGLVRGEAPRLDTRLDDDERSEDAVTAAPEAAAAWADNIRFSLPGSAQTGSCLHDILETYALACSGGHAGRDTLDRLTREQLGLYGLDEALPADGHGSSVADRVSEWLDQCLRHPLPGQTDLDGLFRAGRAVPEMRFDFAIGGARDARFEAINTALSAAGLRPLERYGTMSGLMTGAIDLVYEQDRRFYVVDYKSNTLGRTPDDYGDAGMANCIADHRYDLQYMIYAVAAERHFRTRLGARYGYDDGDYRFGGVCYLFLRGMGLPGHDDLGAWFFRPEADHVAGLDRALAGVGP